MSLNPAVICKRISILILELWLICLNALSQNVELLDGIYNHYLSVDEVTVNSVRITDTRGGELNYFQPGDKALIIQMTGVTIDSSDADFKIIEARSRESFQNIGNFEILQVDEVITGTDTTITFTDDLSRAYDTGERIQLVRFVEGETVTLAGTVTAAEWDGNSGGIVAIIGTDSIKLNGDIDVSYLGFRGGAIPEEIYAGGCRLDISYGSPNLLDTLYFRPTETGRAGNKGEGIITATWPYTKGSGFNINGGGGGNGLYSGGGGGANYKVGGDGGSQSSSCTDAMSALGAWGGYSCQELYTNPEKPRVIMGGGGGGANKANMTYSSKGGNGGGMIFLITETLSSNSSSYTLSASGEDVNPAGSNGGGSGGGAGGTILIDVTNYIGSGFTISLQGGNGGSAITMPTCYGTGGGGSGGVIWHSGSVFPTNVIIDTLNGTGGAGSILLCPNQSGRQGGSGTRLKNLIMPLTGFLFNSIKGTDTICEGQIPDLLTASQPKGGNGSYDYVWQQSNDNIFWESAIGVAELRSFQPPALSQTTYYRRIVSSTNVITLEAIYDTSRAIQVFVYPAIANNSITGTDTICYNDEVKPLKGIATPLAGGNGIYSYQWQQSIDMLNWTNNGTDTVSTPGAITESTYYRRVVNSSLYCSDTSNSVLVTVLPLITNNQFSTGVDTAICMNSSPGELNALNPEGGDGSYSYLWQSKTNTTDWEDLESSNVIRYTVGELTDTTIFRRIVYSGNDNACIDTSSGKKVIIMPPITNNTVKGSAIQYTCFNSPISLEGSDPVDGFGPGTYAYAWEQSSDNLIWEATTGTDRDFQSDDLNETTYVRRIVYSTPQYHECSATSDPVEVRINPLPAGNVVNMYDTVCAGETLYVKFNVTGNGPFNVTIEGEELEEQSKSNVIGPTDSIAFIPVSTQQFIVISVEDDSSCFADETGFNWITPVTVYDVPVANAGIDSAVCSDTYSLLAVQSVDNSSGLWTSSDASFTDPTNPNSQVTANQYGTAVLTWTETNWHCTDMDEVEITFYERPQLAEAGPDQVLDFIFTTELQATPASVGDGKWTLISGYGEFDDDTQPNAVISELENNTSLKWTVINGNCPATSDSMSIIIEPLVITKGFTPNGDGKNDFFDLGAVNAEKISLKIFNSAGVLVFESDNYLEGEHWEGYNLDGVELPEGTYYYIANIKVSGRQKEIRFKSFVEILR